jgi:glycosyltransferase involved in cell wall biosynthesis
MSTIKVLHVIARMNVGGTARYVGDLVEKIPNSALATGFVQGSEIEDGVVGRLNVHRIPHLGRRIAPIQDFRSWLELRRLVKRLEPEIVHTHTFKAGMIGRLVRGKHKRVHTFHGHLFDDHSFSSLEKGIITLVERFLARRTNVLISVGIRVGEELRSARVGQNGIWLSIPPGVSALPKIKKSDAREILNLDQDTFLVGWMARMTRVKNPFLLLEVARRMPSVRFAMAGGGDLLSEIRSTAPENVSVIGWTDAPIFWSAVDCAISTSDNEGMPISLIEAQLAGLPVIATNVGSTSEIVADGVTGIITEPDLGLLVIGLDKLVSNEIVFREMKKYAELNALREFSPERMISEHKLIYSKL